MCIRDRARQDLNYRKYCCGEAGQPGPGPVGAGVYDAQVRELSLIHISSAQDKNYRLTLDSSICDGDTLYVVITVEGLHEQAVENLKNNQVVADCYRAAWGREMPENLMEQGQGDISVFQFQMEAGNHMSLSLIHI